MTVMPMRSLATVTLALLFSACTLFPEQPAHRVFQLPGPDMKTANTATIDTALRVSTPHAASPIDSTRILVKPDAHEIRSYQGARWSNKVPVIFRDYLLESFRQDGQLATVVNDTSPARSDLTLAGDLTAFQAEYRDGQPVIRLQFNAHLIDERSRATVASRRFTVSETAGGEEIEQVVEAFGAASNVLARQVVNWTLEQP